MRPKIPFKFKVIEGGKKKLEERKRVMEKKFENFFKAELEPIEHELKSLFGSLDKTDRKAESLESQIFESEGRNALREKLLFECIASINALRERQITLYKQALVHLHAFLETHGGEPGLNKCRAMIVNYTDTMKHFEQLMEDGYNRASYLEENLKQLHG
ncbi:MAG: hypothetical protein NUV57_02230 [archaeon]|nr:hypothetical protein [archaeon]